MTGTIDVAKLKAAAEHLEWVLGQYLDNEDVQGLLHALLPLIEQAKAGRIVEPAESMQDIPGAYNFSDGRYAPYKSPDVGEAYAIFVSEMEGGLTEEEKQLFSDIDEIRRSINQESTP
ncbi:MAG: hypothetical protein JSR70_11295 [Proteobacteria bacterium]|nr:hypothetical protein [Pseudomonadota bacterium]